MENKSEGQEPQKNPVAEPTAEKVSISKEELEELKSRAEASSQNFERAKKAESEVKELKQTLEEYNEPLTDPLDEDKLKELEDVKKRLDSYEEKQALNEVFAEFPELKDLSEEFNQYRSEFPRHKLSNVAKLFLSEKGVLNKPPVRDGLEKPVSGDKTPQPSGYTLDELRVLREEHPRQYEKLIDEGKIKL